MPNVGMLAEVFVPIGNARRFFARCTAGALRSTGRSSGWRAHRFTGTRADVAVDDVLAAQDGRTVHAARRTLG